MGCTYSSPRDEPTLRSVPDVVSLRLLPGQGCPGGVKRVPCGADQQSWGGSPGGQRDMGPAIPSVLVCRLHFPAPEGKEFGLETRKAPVTRFFPLEKSGSQVHSPV